jgi:undecaprenyl diphosphate synthase
LSLSPRDQDEDQARKGGGFDRNEPEAANLIGKDKGHQREEQEKEDLPRHIAIIMDGNGRWAQKRGLPRIVGHRAGAKAAREIVQACGQWGIEVLTLYTFSMENWRRPKSETSALMLLLEEFIQREIGELMSNDVQLRTLGRMEGLPVSTQRQIGEATAHTRGNKGLILNLALNYGGRTEIVDATKSILLAVESGRMSREDLNEESFGRFLYTASLPDPDLLIRTGGDMRISNFLLYQLAYAELWVTPTFWPDFTPQDLSKAISAYQQRERRFGMTGEQCRRVKPKKEVIASSRSVPGVSKRGHDAP